MKKRSIILVAGGTGGHFFPAQSVYKVLQQKKLPVLFVTDKRGAALQSDLGQTALCMPLVMRKKGIGNRIKFLLSLFSSMVWCWRLFMKHPPFLILGFGGYPTAPCLCASLFIRCQRWIHEQNTIMGQVNACFLPTLHKILLSFPLQKPLTARYTSKINLVGLPIRRAIQKIGRSVQKKRDVPSSKTLLVIGGSQGAYVFGEVVPAAFKLLPAKVAKEWTIIQQCRPEQVEKVQRYYEDLKIKATVCPFIEDMAAAYQASSIVLMRSGASSLAEVAVLQKPCWLVPLPSSKHNHQYFNARYMEDAGLGRVIPQEECTPKKLAKRLKEVSQKEVDMHCNENMLSMHATADSAIAKLIIAQWNKDI